MSRFAAFHPKNKKCFQNLRFKFKGGREKESAAMVIETKIRKRNKRNDMPEKKESCADSGEESTIVAN